MPDRDPVMYVRRGRGDGVILPLEPCDDGGSHDIELDTDCLGHTCHKCGRKLHALPLDDGGMRLISWDFFCHWLGECHFDEKPGHSWTLCVFKKADRGFLEPTPFVLIKPGRGRKHHCWRVLDPPLYEWRQCGGSLMQVIRDAIKTLEGIDS